MAAPTPERERKGPWANRVLSTEIERTHEYNEFIDKLRAYHQKRGTTLTIEPELGRKLLDLRKLYNKVTSLGGYDKVTEEKGCGPSINPVLPWVGADRDTGNSQGAWRDLALGYKLAANNTNAGYLLKTIYYKNLAAYEISNFFGKEPPPKEWLEERSAAGGSIMTRTAEDFQEASPRPESKGDKSPTPPPSEKRIRDYPIGLRQAPTPRTFYNPDTTPQRQHSSRMSSDSRQQGQQGSPNNQMNGSTLNFPSFQSSSINAPIGRPVATPRNAPHEFINHKRRAAEVLVSNPNRHGGIYPFRAIRGEELAGHQGAALMVRISMGLKSGIPSEVDYALSQLVRISFESGDELRAESYPGLSEALFEKLVTVQSLADTRYPEGTGELLEDSKFVKQLEKINEAALVLRNMSLQPDNARYFSRLKNGRQIIVACMNLPGQSCFVELKHYALDMVEAMAIHFSLAVDDDLFPTLHANLLSDDRGLVLGSLKAICRLVMGRDEANCIGQINKCAIDRIKALIMLEDEDLVSACLDFLYQYTTNEENVEKLIQPPDGIEIVKQLTRLLLHQAVPGDQVVFLTGSLKPIIKPPVIPNLPQEIVTDLLSYAEPDRAAKWMRCCFEEDPGADITQIALWQAYQARFTEYVAAGRPLLPAAEFIKNVSVAFNNASAMVLPIPGGGQKFIIKGIKARETPMSVKGQVYLACKWITGTNSNTSGTETAQQQPAQPIKCPSQLATPQDLWVHILKDHLSPPDATQQPQAMLLCNWGGCERFHPAGDSDRRKVIAHVRTHMPETSPPKSSHPSSRYPTASDWLEDPKQVKLVIRRNQTGIDDRGEAAGIPLTAVLVLRNVARRGMFNGKELLSGERPVLFEIMAVNKPLATYIADLLVEEDEGEVDD
ncbi:unnamed protein product [Tuber aestivum]|uniref:RFX-type winged-helix domain-containing protein n=1 Tax=Tuber aestivum TaxID=59557 RepID=A0A292PZN3_9PEZI|nr:unnamed protein product [Tuber aestivum]